MGKRIAQTGLDLYSEICPASSATIIGAGMLSVAMGSIAPGFAVIATGVGLGILAPYTKQFSRKR